MKVFVPITDDMIERGELNGLLLPYRPGRPLLSQYREIDLPGQSRSRVSKSPGTTPSSEALPALSSRTYCAGPALG